MNLRNVARTALSALLCAALAAVAAPAIAQDKLDKPESRQTTARVLAAVGGALLVTSGVLLAVDLTRSRTAEVSVRCSGTGCLLAGRGAF